MQVHRPLALFTLAVASMAIVNAIPYSFPDRGSVSTYSTVGQAGNLTVGYGLVQPASGTTTPAGFSVIYFRQDGVLVCPSAVPAVPAVASGRTYAEFNGTVHTGIAIANPTNTTVTVSFYFTNSATGSDFGQGSFTLAAGNQIAAFVNEAPFNATTNFTGSFTFNATAPVGITALRGFTNERNEFLVTAQPVASITQPSTAPLVMAQFADGGGWTTSVELLNTTDVIMNGRVQFYNEGSSSQAGQPVNISVNGLTASSFAYSLPPHASVHFDTAGLSSTTQIGSVIVTPESGSSSPAGQVLFSFVNNGIHVTEAPVAAEPVSTAFRMFVQTGSSNGAALGQPNSFESGLAISNPSSTATTVNLQLFDPNGASVGSTVSLSLPAFGHVAKFLHELFPSVSALISTTGFTGVLRVTSTSGPIAVTDLLTYYNERDDFLITAVPPSDETAAPSTANLIFPQVAVGGGGTVPAGTPLNGYYMQFVLFSGIAGQTGNGNITFFTQSDQPFDLFNTGP
jgi:hypothetical protein